MFQFVTPSANAQTPDYSLWDKFIKYDLCITDYDSLTDYEKELCHFIFDTEQSADETIRCERARRILSHDENIGTRINLEQLDGAYGIWDNYSSQKVGYYNYIHCVPDIKCIDGWNDYNEYWLDNEGTIRVRFTGEMGSKWQYFEIYGDNNYKIEAKKMPQIDKENLSDEYINFNGDYYYICPDNTAVLAKSKYSRDNDSETEPIKGKIIVPDEVNGYPVIAIDETAFIYAPITEIVLPDTLRYIGFRAFDCCSYLENINIPENLEYMGECAFECCDSLKELTINAPELNIPYYAFYSCRNLTDINLNVKSIGESSFRQCINLKNLNLGNNVETICSDAFYNCTSIESIQIPASLKVIGTGAFSSFSHDSKIKSVNIPPNVEIIGALPAQRGIAPTSGLYIPETHPLTDELDCIFDNNQTICSYKNTEAYIYADKWNLNFVELKAKDGDVNLDSEFNIADLVIFQSWLLGKTNVKCYQPDVNNDGFANVFDLIDLKNKFINNVKTS